jgi:hypothetical protein
MPSSHHLLKEHPAVGNKQWKEDKAAHAYKGVDARCACTQAGNIAACASTLKLAQHQHLAVLHRNSSSMVLVANMAVPSCSCHAKVQTALNITQPNSHLASW